MRPDQTPALSGAVEAGRAALSRADWIAAAQQRYGTASIKWRFRCPVCGVATSVEEWRAADAPEGAVAFSCIGRYLPGTPAKAFGTGKIKQPCDYAGGGLFAINPVQVVDDEGRVHGVFDFADDPLFPKDRKPKRKRAALSAVAAAEGGDRG